VDGSLHKATTSSNLAS